MATSAFQRIREGFPDAEIHCGLRPYLRPLLSNNPFFDGYLPMPKVGFKGLLQQVAAIREQNFDLAIVLPNSLATGLAVRLAGVPRRLGYKQGRPLTMTQGLRAASNRSLFRRHGPRRLPKPMPQYYDDLLDLLQIPAGTGRPALHRSEEEEFAVDRWLQDHGLDAATPLVLLNAGASYGGSKMWAADRFAALGREYAQQGLTPIYLAGPKEVEMVQAIARQADALAAVDPVLPLSDLKALVGRAKLMVTTDTGPRHIAVALGVPTVCIMGPTDRRYTDYALEQQKVIQKQLPCVPCQRKVCPLRHHDCMGKIQVDEVMVASQALLPPQ